MALKIKKRSVSLQKNYHNDAAHEDCNNNQMV